MSELEGGVGQDEVHLGVHRHIGEGCLDKRQLEDKIRSGERLNFADGCLLFRESDLLWLGSMANILREKLHSDITYYNRNLHLNPTNVCEADCLFCSFARLQSKMPNAYTMSMQQALEWIEKRVQAEMTEIHIVGGLNPDLPFSYYTDLLSSIKRVYPHLHIKAFTAVEIHYFSEKFGLSYKEILSRLIAAGLGSLPGGGAEIFAPRARRKLCRDKADADQWLEVHRTAHSLGLMSNSTMLYGTIEYLEERVDHLLRLRELQDESLAHQAEDSSRGIFQAFIPLAYHPEGNRLGPIGGPTGADDLRTIAVSRLLLDNIAHLKAYWVMLGVKTAQLAQRFGANDFDGTVTEEKIYRMSGSQTPEALTVSELVGLITDIGRRPVERSTLYQIVERPVR